MVVGVRRKDEDFVFAPRSEYLFRNGDTVVAIGTPESCEQTLTNLKNNHVPQQASS